VKKLLFIVLAFISFFSACGKPEQTVNEIVLELGEEIPTNANAYFNITEKQLEHLTIDLSQVDVTQCGKYEILCSYKNNIYTVNVEIKDTVAPVLKESSSFEIECGEPFTLSDFQIEIIDKSPSTFNFTDATITNFAYQDEEYEIQGTLLCIYAPGTYTLELCLTDEFNNITISTIEVIAKDTTAPVINGAEKLEVDYGASIDLLAGITALDTVDGDISNQITVSEIDTSKSGKQICTYTVSDSAGNMTEVQRDILVKEKPKASKPSSLARSTSLECVQIVVTYSIYGESDTTWTETFGPTVTVGEVSPVGDGFPIKGETVMLRVSDLWLTFTNGNESITLNMGELCNRHGEPDEPFWYGRKIVAHQTMYIEGTPYYCYMYDDGRVLMHTDRTRIDYAYWPDQMIEWFGPYGYNETNWIYY